MYDYKYLLDQFPNCYTFLFIISGSSWKISMLHIIIPVIPGGFFRKNIKYKCLTKIVLVLRKVAECGQLRSKVKTLLHEHFFTWYMCIPFILSGSPKNLKKSWLHVCRARAITTWRIGLRAPLFARNYEMDAAIRYLHGLFVYGVTCSSRSEKWLRHEVRGREKFFCSHLYAPSPRSERLEDFDICII